MKVKKVQKKLVIVEESMLELEKDLKELRTEKKIEHK